MNDKLTCRPAGKFVIHRAFTEKRKKKNMRKPILTITTLILITLLTTANLTAQTHIRFQRGATSATVSGKIGVNRGVAGSNYRSYVLRASAGQVISATVSSRNGKVVFAENDETTRTIETDSDDDYILRIYNGGERSANYTITVSIR